MSPMKTRSENNFEQKELAKRFQWLPHIFDNGRLRYDADNMPRHRELKISSGLVADKMSSGCRPMSAYVGSVTSESGTDEHVVVADGSTLPVFSVQNYFHSRFSWATF